MRVLNIKNASESEYALNEAFKAIRTNIMFSSYNTKVITLTSCDARDGKSAVSFEVAKSLSDVGKKVLYLDADMRRSAFVIRHTAEKDLVGLSHFLSGQAQSSEIVYATDIEGLYVVPAGVYPPNPAELLSGAIFSDFILELREKFDYIIIDTPPLGIVTDAAICAAISDGAIFLISSETTKVKQAKEVKALLEKNGAKIIGCILNKVKYKTKGKYYKKGYYRYGY
jgi:capsular exopolysaccharide synthesis family protein